MAEQTTDVARQDPPKMPATTPHPWKAVQSRGLNSYEIRGGNDAYLADVWGVDIPVPNGVAIGEVKANARLIAASPLLLNACKAAREAYGNLLWEGGQPPDEICDQLDLAIQKAEGVPLPPQEKETSMESPWKCCECGTRWTVSAGIHSSACDCAKRIAIVRIERDAITMSLDASLVNSAKSSLGK